MEALPGNKNTIFNFTYIKQKMWINCAFTYGCCMYLSCIHMRISSRKFLGHSDYIHYLQNILSLHSYTSNFFLKNFFVFTL